MDESERKLIDECLAGRTEAFEALIRPYQDRIYNTLLRFIGNPDDAAELFQDAMLRVYRGMKSYQGDSHFYTWMYRIVLNVAFSFRRRRRMNAISIESVAGRGGLPPASETSATRSPRAAELEETRVFIESALRELPRVYRAVLILKDVEGMRYEEIADILDVPVGTVRSRLHRARGEMRQRLRPLMDRGII